MKIYKATKPIDIGAEVTAPDGFEIIYRRFSPEQAAAVMIMRETVQPRWTTLDLFARVEYDLVVICYDERAKLLLLNSSRRETGFYETLAAQYTGGEHSILPLSRINRVLAELTNPEFFNIGMKNVIPHSQNESYRIITGPRAHEAIRESDGRLFHRGHAFGKFEANGAAVTLGYSSASKVWANRGDNIPELIHWSRDLARKIDSDLIPAPTGSGFDSLNVGEEISQLPDGATVIAADWDADAYRNGIIARYPVPDGGRRECLLVDVALSVERHAGDATKVVMHGDGLRGTATLRVQADGCEVKCDSRAEEVTLVRGTAEMNLGHFLRSHPFDLYLSDFARVRGAELFRAGVASRPFDPTQLVTVDWLANGVNITEETRTGRGDSIHEYMARALISPDVELLVFDHRSGEIADFVGVRRIGGYCEIQMYHCKKSGAPSAGARVDDLYEVCGQVVRSIRWCQKLDELKQQLVKRTASGSEVLVGSRDGLGELFDGLRTSQVRFRVVLVQPGVSKAALDERMSHIIAAASDYLGRAEAELELWVSA